MTAALGPAEDRALAAAQLTAAREVVAGYPAGPGTWLRFRLAIRAQALPGSLCRSLAALARSGARRGLLRDFDFERTERSLELRFRIASGDRGACLAAVTARLDAWANAGLVSGWSAGADWEPGPALRGAAAQPSVARALTADALLWLSLHGWRTDLDGDGLPTWAVSLLALRSLFAVAEVDGPEDLDVWHRAWRRLDDGSARLPAHRPLHDVAVLMDAGRIEDILGLPPSIRARLITYERALRQDWRWWPNFHHGPREACAELVLRHWNHALLGRDAQRRLLLALLARRAWTPDR